MRRKRLTDNRVSGFAHSKFQRLIASVERIPFSGCWIWTGAIAEHGYGRYGKGDKYAHRLSYEFFVGPVPPELFVCHRCDIPCCVNPSHLFLGTIQDNTADMYAKGRDRHPRGERHSNAKLTTEQVIAIRAEYRAWDRSASTTALGLKYGVDRKSIHAIIQRKKWAHI
jgi:hypothetical protein